MHGKYEVCLFLFSKTKFQLAKIILGSADVSFLPSLDLTIFTVEMLCTHYKNCIYERF